MHEDDDMPPPTPTTTSTPPRAPDSSTARVTSLLRGAVAALAVAVAVMMVVLWPSGAAGDGGGPASTLPPTEQATVVATSTAPCLARDGSECLEVTIKLITGPDAGDRATFTMGEAEDEAAPSVGDEVRVVKSQVPEDAQIGGVDVPPYSFSDYERRSPITWLVAIFVAIVLVAGRLHGLRALIGLTASLGVIVWFVVPALVEGEHPLAVALVGALAVMLLTIPLSHGFGPTTLAATLGTTASLLITLALAWTFTKLAHLTGYSGDEVAYLSAYLGDLSIQGLLLAGVVIAALGVLDDVTVSQASTVVALRRANPALTAMQLYREALVVGRDHIAATVNTLVLAYVGSSLPILLIFAVGDVGVSDAFNGEAVAAQVVATLTGSIGLITAVPVTTGLAAVLAVRMQPSELARAGGHSHSHAHAPAKANE